MPALLDGITAVFGAAFAPLYHDGLLKRRTYDTDDAPLDVSPAGEGIKLQRNACTEAMRGEDGYTDKDVRFIVLSAGIAAKPNTDDIIVYGGREWSIRSIDTDPAGSHWIIRATPRKGNG